jgi:membrane protease subunit (stomatin/prohibitin family)
MGIVGNAGQTDKIFSGTILLEGGSCFLLSNGVSASIYGNANLFSTNCFIAPSIEPLLLDVYPNPFIEKIKIKSHTEFNYAKTVMYDLHLYNAAGIRIKTFATSIYVLRSGYEISIPFLATGTYYLKVQVGQLHIQTITLIKSQ